MLHTGCKQELLWGVSGLASGCSKWWVRPKSRRCAPQRETCAELKIKPSSCGTRLSPGAEKQPRVLFHVSLAGCFSLSPRRAESAKGISEAQLTGSIDDAPAFCWPCRPGHALPPSSCSRSLVKGSADVRTGRWGSAELTRLPGVLQPCFRKMLPPFGVVWVFIFCEFVQPKSLSGQFILLYSS